MTAPHSQAQSQPMKSQPKKPSSMKLSTMNPPPMSSRRTTISLAVLVLLIAAIGAASGGMFNRPDQLRGDRELAAALSAALEQNSGPAAVAVVDGRSATFGYLGSWPEDEYEIGSITKLFTSDLLIQAVVRGEVRPDTEVGSLLDLEGEIGRTTLRELAAGTSGLSAWGATGRPPKEQTDQSVSDNPPFPLSRADLLSRANRDPLATRGEYRYSNVGFALLGQALAEAAGTSYADLLAERIFRPQQMDASRLGQADQRDQSRGYAPSGRRVQPWNLGAFEPAGGARSTIVDMANWVRALVSSASGPGRMLQWAVDSEDTLGWTIESDNDETRLSKGGLTGGFASQVAVAPDRSCGVIVLTASGVRVDTAAVELLDRCR